MPNVAFACSSRAGLLVAARELLPVQAHLQARGPVASTPAWLASTTSTAFCLTSRMAAGLADLHSIAISWALQEDSRRFHE